MRSLLVLSLAVGCGYGPTSYEYQARLVVGLESQEVPMSALDPRASTASWLTVQTTQASVAYPVRVDGDMLVLDSVFSEMDLSSVYEPHSFEELTSSRLAGSTSVPLRMPLAKPDRTLLPPVAQHRGEFSITLIGDGPPLYMVVQVNPAFGGCDVVPESEIEAQAVPSSGCLSGACPFEVLDIDARSVRVAPFVVSTRVQVACMVSSG